MQLLLILALCLIPLAQALDPPPVTIQYRVWEEQPSGSKVGRLSEDLEQRGEGGALEDFRIVEQGQSLPFAVEVQDGTVSTVGRLDREELCWNSNLCEILFSVLYRKDGLVHFLRVRVEVLDLNDHSPVFPNEEQEVEISEMATLRMRIPLDRAVDPDAGPNGLQTYSLSSNQHFALDVKNPSAGPKQAELVVIKELDREVQSSYELTLVAWDKGNPPRSGSTLVKINVLDSNDNSPVFDESMPTIELGEDTARGTTVINLKATDPDQGANGEIEYSFSKHAPLDVQRLFNIEPKTGAVTLTGMLDFEVKPSYEIDIQARDLGPNAIPSHCKLHIKVRDVNDNAPRIHIAWTPPDSPVATVSEDAGEETFLALVMVSDADSGENGNVHIHIQHGTGPFRLKRIHGDNYMIVTNGTLDREKKMEYNLTLVARDHGKPPLSSIRHLPVHVLDENDNAPIFSLTQYRANVFENNSPGLSILEVQAQDIDLDLGGKVSYSIRESNDLSTPTASFSIDPPSGIVFIEQALDYEESHMFSFIVEATDQGQPPLTSSATVIVDVQDVNDNYPVIEDPLPKKGRASLSVPVNAEKGEIVAELGDKEMHNGLFEHYSGMNNQSAHIRSEGYLAATIRASDADSGLNGKLLFQIVSGNSAGLFWLDDSTGQLYVNTSNATELIDKKFEFDISVSDMGSPVLVTTVTLEVTFINLLDHLKNSSPGLRGQLSFTMMLAICLGATCLLLLLAVALVTTFCRPEKRDNHAYNCRQAESTYTRHPRRPQKHIQKADIQLVPVLRGRREESQEAEARPLTSVTPEPEEPFPPGPFHLSPSLSRTIRNQNFPEEHLTLPLSQGRTLRKPVSVELNGTLPRTPATPYRTLRRARASESSSTLSQTSTLRRHGGSEAQLQLEDSELDGPGSPPTCTLRRPRNPGGQGAEEHRQILRNLVRLSMAAFGENNPIELSAASPEVQQVSQLLSLLHQGQLQPRPNFRGNKYSHRTGRSGMQDADWLSTKDSGHGESEMGDADWDVGRESPIDPLLGDGLHSQIADDVFSDVPDPEWMARLSLPLSADYHDNVFVPEGPASPASPAPTSDAPGDSASFSTFGKTPEKEGALPGSLLSEVSTLFEMLLTQKADAQPRTSAEVLYRLSAAYRRSMGLDTPSPGAEKRPPLTHCPGPDSQNQHLN